MSANLTQVLDLVQTTLDGNSAINDHCLSVFQRLPTIFIGLNPANPPKFDGNCPMIVAGPGTRHREESQAHRVHQLRIGVAIQSSTQTHVGQIVRFAGLAMVDDLANLVEKIITRALNANSYASIQEPETEDETIGDIFKVIWTYQIRCPSRLKEATTP